MKKLSVKLLSLIITILLILPLVFSCGEETPAQESKPTVIKSFEEMDEEEKAFYLLKSGVIEKTTNMRIDSKMIITGSVNGLVPVEIKITTSDVDLTSDSGEYTHNSITRVSAKSQYSSASTFVMYGYQDGKMYIFTSTNGETSRQWSPVSEEDYKKCIKDVESSAMSGFGDLEVTRGSCILSENGNYIATYSGASKGLIALFEKILTEYASVFKIPPVEDVVLTYELTPDLKLISIKIDLVFKKEPYFDFSMITNATYDNISFEKIDLEGDGFVQVEDLRDQLKQ